MMVRPPPDDGILRGTTGHGLISLLSSVRAAGRRLNKRNMGGMLLVKSKKKQYFFARARKANNQTQQSCEIILIPTWAKKANPAANGHISNNRRVSLRMDVCVNCYVIGNRVPHNARAHSITTLTSQPINRNSRQTFMHTTNHRRHTTMPPP